MPTPQNPANPHTPAAGIASFLSDRLGGSERLVAHVTYPRAVVRIARAVTLRWPLLSTPAQLLVALSSPFLCD